MTVTLSKTQQSYLMIWYFDYELPDKVLNEHLKQYYIAWKGKKCRVNMCLRD